VGRGVAVVLLAVLVAPPAAAAEGAWFGVSGSGGWIKPDADLADYRRDVRPGAAWGLEGRAGRGAWALGLRALTATSPQDLGPIGAGASPVVTDVRTSRYELVARRRVARFGGQEFVATASGGRARIAFDPGAVAVDDGTGGTLVVALDPVSTWTWGAGVAVERPLVASWRAGLEGDFGRYAMDTAHRAGETIVRERTAFTDWSVRIVLGWNTAH
jgi:hypothetical protein